MYAGVQAIASSSCCCLLTTACALLLVKRTSIDKVSMEAVGSNFADAT
jgi:hypothetical protein